MPETEPTSSPDRDSSGSRRSVPRWVVVAAVPVVAITVVVGVWIAGSLSESAATAMALTTVWFVIAGLAALVVAVRWRTLAVPILATFVLTSASIGGYLLYTSSVDQVVNEDVLVAAPLPTTDNSNDPVAESSAPVALASGAFRSQAHETTGKATIIERPNGDRVLTLTNLATDPGPDLRVYLVPGDGSSTKNSVDLGALKGNKGNQQYDVPADAPTGAVIIWCRSFTVAFGTATLA